MSVVQARTEVSLRSSELREHLVLVRALESADPTVPDTNEVLILRGLYYVHLYSLIEYTINQAVVEALRFIKETSTPYNQLVEDFLPVALDPDFSSFSAVGRKGKNWDRRFSFIRKERSGDACSPNEAVLGYDLQNIWCETLEFVFKCFSISDPVVPDPRFRPFIDEIVNKRNAVAHGRETAARVGRGTRSPDLELRFQAVVDTCNYLLDRFDLYIANLEFVQVHARASIRARLAT